MRIRSLFLLLALQLVRCGSPVLPETTSVTVVLDRSSDHLLQTLGADIPEIVKSLGLERNPWGGADMRLTFISDVGYHSAQELHLPAELEGEGNILIREHRVRSFEGQVTQLIRQHAGEQESRDGSVIYLKMANELALLGQSSARHRLLIVYTDLLEHGADFSYYEDETLDSVRAYPQVFIERLERKRPLGTLGNVSVAFAAIPKNQVNSGRVTVAYTLWERMLTAHGARVSISGNYIYHKP